MMVIQKHFSDFAYVCVAGATLWLRGVLPEDHLDAETKDLVKLGMGLIGTMTALLLAC